MNKKEEVTNAYFINALRECLKLDPIPYTDHHPPEGPGPHVWGYRLSKSYNDSIKPHMKILISEKRKDI